MQKTGWLRERDALMQRTQEGRPAPETDPKRVSLSSIKLCEEVFQHRSGNQAVSDAHVDALHKALEHNPDKPFDPVTVWWGGNGWYCIDGHHRLAAYRRTDCDWCVPVSVFRGTMGEAIAQAMQGNSKDKLPMGRKEKSEGAWRLVVGAELSKPVIAAAAGVSESQVAIMRRTASAIRKSHPGERLDALRWVEADRIAKGLEPRGDVGSSNWVEEEAQKLADRMCKKFGKQLGANIEVTARALEIYSQPLADGLAEHWHPNPDELD